MQRSLIALARQRFSCYATLNGRHGARVYETWADVKEHTRGYKGCRARGFISTEEAEKYIRLNLLGAPDPDQPSTLAAFLAPKSKGGLIWKGKAAAKLSPPNISLSKEQEAVRQKVVQDGRSIFFTGCAGAGKSVLLRKIIEDLRRIHGKAAVAVTATTGIAANMIGGGTLHTWAGIGIGKGSKEELEVLLKKKRRIKKWREVRVLIIDEVSMLDAVLFDKLEYLARKLRGDPRPFGGIQLILSGDFYQLPPVLRTNEEPLLSYEELIEGYMLESMGLAPEDQAAGYRSRFVFDAKTWTDCVQDVLMLQTVFRQEDPEFVKMLNEVRHGKLTPKTISVFESLSRNVEYDDDIPAVELYPLRAQVSAANRARLASLPSPPHIYPAVDYSQRYPFHREKSEKRRQEYLRNARRYLELCTLAQTSLELKLGASVMLIQNMELERLVNGSLGIVVGFWDFETERVVEGRVNEDILRVARVAWPVGKQETSGGAEVEKAEATWPIVRFTTGQMLIIPPVTFEVQDAKGKTQAKRTQIPLILAWSISIHKSQGQTLDRVKIDLGKAFATGQAYVALSRATSLQGLQVDNFDPSKVTVDPRVVEWSEQLQTVDIISSRENEGIDTSSHTS